MEFGIFNSPDEVAIEAVQLFGSMVIPAFDKDPVRSTTRQREAPLGRCPQPAGT